MASARRARRTLEPRARRAGRSATAPGRYWASGPGRAPAEASVVPSVVPGGSYAHTRVAGDAREHGRWSRAFPRCARSRNPSGCAGPPRESRWVTRDRGTRGRASARRRSPPSRRSHRARAGCPEPPPGRPSRAGRRQRPARRVSSAATAQRPKSTTWKPIGIRSRTGPDRTPWSMGVTSPLTSASISVTSPWPVNLEYTNGSPFDWSGGARP